MINLTRTFTKTQRRKERKRTAERQRIDLRELQKRRNRRNRQRKKTNRYNPELKISRKLRDFSRATKNK
jgi:hypothetical protein